jgi:hypothetical protein
MQGGAPGILLLPENEYVVAFHVDGTILPMKPGVKIAGRRALVMVVSTARKALARRRKRQAPPMRAA